MTTTSSEGIVEALNRYVGEGTGYRSVSFLFPVKPQACPRPRVTRNGITFYPKNYTEWRKAVAPFIPEVQPHLGGPLAVAIVHAVPPYKTVSREFDRADIDNYAKSVLDVITKSKRAVVDEITAAGRVWQDDSQVTQLFMEKRWTHPGEDPNTFVYIRER